MKKIILLFALVLYSFSSIGQRSDTDRLLTVKSKDSILEKPRVINMLKGFEQKQLVEALCQRCGYKERF